MDNLLEHLFSIWFFVVSVTVENPDKIFIPLFAVAFVLNIFVATQIRDGGFFAFALSRNKSDRLTPKGVIAYRTFQITGVILFLLMASIIIPALIFSF